MPHADHIDQFIRLFFAGVGMILLGGLNLLMRRASVRSRVVASVAVGALVLAGYALWESNSGAIGRVVAVVGVGLLPALLLGSRRLLAFGTALLQSAQKPAVRWGLLTLGGFGLIAHAGASFTQNEERAYDTQISELDIQLAHPPLAVVERVPAKTDRGSGVVVRGPEVERGQAAIDDPEDRVMRTRGYDQFVIRRAPATDHTNCHGWVFTGGRYWVSGESVGQILSDNNYTAVTDPQAGDLAIYRNEQGVAHTALVRYVADGMPPLVESKWAWMGVFLHPVDKSAYGTDFTYYRSPRSGHVLSGLQPPSEGPTAP